MMNYKGGFLFLRIFKADLSIASEFFGIFLVITLPAPILDLDSITTGAIFSFVSESKYDKSFPLELSCELKSNFLDLQCLQAHPIPKGNQIQCQQF